jgi:hypothetical protein
MLSEFPVDNPKLLELIKKFMIYGPCSQYNPNIPCMDCNACIKGFSKPFLEHTIVINDFYARIRCFNTG